MEQRRFGSTKREVAAIGQGTWYIDRCARASAIAALRQGLDLGMTHIDTAQMYGSAEEVVAEAIALQKRVVASSQKASRVRISLDTRNFPHLRDTGYTTTISGFMPWIPPSISSRI
ncbi:MULTISPECIES: aldo/keto reductase [Nostocales]|uniref:Aldo/keto reductase n=2 Tax=Nostocales TaxID=1161 RepID=A0ABW8WFT1_9CYAN|nr:aldo/keto reductase [Tolypothrix bouteillei]